MPDSTGAGWVQQFIDALHQLEDQGSAEAVVGLFAPDSGIWNIAQSQPLRGQDGARTFWERYRRQFREVYSTFERTIIDGDQAALEWRAEGRLPEGTPLQYRGVTLLKRGPSGITEFASYFDLEPFMKDAMNTTGAPSAQSEAPYGMDAEAKRPTSVQSPMGMDAESAQGPEELEDVAPEREERVPSTNSYG